MRDFDAIVIGSGAGGLTAALALLGAWATPRATLVFENAALRQQLAVHQWATKRPPAAARRPRLLGSSFVDSPPLWGAMVPASHAE